MTSFWFSLVLFILFSPLFSPHFSFHLFTWSLIDHSDILLDFRSILIEFPVHMLSPCFLVFFMQVWPFSGPSNARYGLRGRAIECEGAWGALGDARTQWCAHTQWCARTSKVSEKKDSPHWFTRTKHKVRPHHLTRASKFEADELGAPAPDVGAPAPDVGVPAPLLGAPAPHHGAPAPVVYEKWSLWLH